MLAKSGHQDVVGNYPQIIHENQKLGSFSGNYELIGRPDSGAESACFHG